MEGLRRSSGLPHPDWGAGAKCVSKLPRPGPPPDSPARHHPANMLARTCLARPTVFRSALPRLSCARQLCTPASKPEEPEEPKLLYEGGKNKVRHMHEIPAH